MLHSYLNIRYNIWFLRKQNIKMQLICYLYPWRKGSEFSIQWADFSGKGQAVWGRETAGGVGKEIMMKSF